jgi:hypothetical protein
MAQHEIQRLLPRHYQILELTLGGNGPKEIAQALGMSPQSISLITNAPNFQSELARRRDTIEKSSNDLMAVGSQRAREMLDEASIKAVDVHIQAMQHFDVKVQQTSASKILDLVLGKNEGPSKPTIIMNVESINLLKIALMESGGGDLAI